MLSVELRWGVTLSQHANKIRPQFIRVPDMRQLSNKNGIRYRQSCYSGKNSARHEVCNYCANKLDWVKDILRKFGSLRFILHYVRHDDFPSNLILLRRYLYSCRLLCMYKNIFGLVVHWNSDQTIFGENSCGTKSRFLIDAFCLHGATCMYVFRRRKLYF